MVSADSEPENFKPEVVDSELEAVALELETTALGFDVAEIDVHYNYKDSNTLGAVNTHMCWHQKLNDIHPGSRFEHYELHILPIDYCNNLDQYL